MSVPNRTRGARGGLGLNPTLGERPARLRFTTAGTPPAKFSFAFLICARLIFLSKRKGNFASVFRPQRFGRARLHERLAVKNFLPLAPSIFDRELQEKFLERRVC